MARGRPARAAAVALVAVVGLGAGLLVADLTAPGPVGDEAAPDGPVGTVRTTGPPPSGTSSTTTSAPPSTTNPSTTTSTAPPPTASTVPTPSTTASTAPPTTAPPPPPLVTVSYLQDPSGALVVTARGSGTITLVNSGGSPGQWLLSPPGGDLAMTATQGTLAPGEQLSITVTDRVGEARRTSISGFVAPAQRVTVPVIVTG